MVLCAALAVTLGPLQARAQDAFESPAGFASNTPNGLKIGQGRLHPFVQLKLDYDSAAGFFPISGTQTSELSPELIAHLEPGFRYDLPTAEVDLNLYAAVDLVRYTGLLTSGSGRDSRVDLDSRLDAGFNRLGVISLKFSDALTRSDRTHDVTLGVGVISLYNQADARLTIRPGGGALELTPHVSDATELLEAQSQGQIPGCTDVSCDPQRISDADSNTVGGGFDARWKFLPKTAVIFESNLAGRAYRGGANPSSLLLKLQGGLAGLLTAKTAVVLKLGWVKDFDQSGLATLIGQAEVTDSVTETITAKLGFLREAAGTSGYGTYVDDRPYVEGRALLDGDVNLHGRLAYDRLDFQSNAGRSDDGITLELGPEYQIRPWAQIAIQYTLSTRSSNLPSQTVNFTRHELFTKLTFSY